MRGHERLLDVHLSNVRSDVCVAVVERSEREMQRIYDEIVSLLVGHELGIMSAGLRTGVVHVHMTYVDEDVREWFRQRYGSVVWLAPTPLMAVDELP